MESTTNEDRPILLKMVACFVIVATCVQLIGLVWAILFGSPGAQIGLDAAQWLIGGTVSWIIAWDLIFLVAGIGLFRGYTWSYMLLLVIIPIRFGLELLLYGFHLLQLAWIPSWVLLSAPKVANYYRHGVDGSNRL